MRKTFVIAAGIAMMLATSVAQAGFVVNCPGSLNAVGPIGNVGNGVCNFNYAGPEFSPGIVTFEGDLTRVNAGDWASEAIINMRNPPNTPVGGGNTPALTATTTYSGTLHIGPTNVNAGGFFTGTSIGNWRFETLESYDDGGTDATWTNLRITVADFAPPAPPTVDVDLGTIGANVPATGSASLAAGQVRWFKFTTTVPIASPNWLTADTLGSVLTANTFGPNDTEVGVYSAAGVLMGTNDDAGGVFTSYTGFGTPPAPPSGGTIVATLPAGVYYAAVSSYNTTFAAGFAVTTTGTTTGTVRLNVLSNVPEPATLVLLAFGAVALIRRRK